MALTEVSIGVNDTAQIWVHKLNNVYYVSDRYSEPGLIHSSGYRDKQELLKEMTRQLEIILDEQLR